MHCFPIETKSKKESQDLRRRVKESAQLKMKRKRLQEANVERKKREIETHKLKSLSGAETSQPGEEGSDDNDNDDDDDDDDDNDLEWYRKEVGEEPEDGGVTLGGGPSRTSRKKGGVERRQRHRAMASPSAKRVRFDATQSSAGRRRTMTAKGHKTAVKKKPLVRFSSQQRGGGRAVKRTQTGRVFRKKAQT